MENFEQQKFIEIMGVKFAIDTNGFVELGEVSRSLLKMQGQYGARYADDIDSDYPNFGQDLRIIGNAGNYHDMKIHADDIEEFVNKVNEFKKSSSK